MFRQKCTIWELCITINCELCNIYTVKISELCFEDKNYTVS